MQATDIGKQRQFWFNSQEIIDHSEYLHILQQRPAKHPANPLVVADRPWEGTYVDLGTFVAYDPATSRWQMWYEAHPAEVLICTALSEDGIRWRKPVLGV